MAKGQTTAEGWTKEVAGLSKVSTGLINAAKKIGEARLDLEEVKRKRAKADPADPEYILADPAELDGIISALADLEGRACTLFMNNAEAHRDTDDDLI